MSDTVSLTEAMQLASKLVQEQEVEKAEQVLLRILKAAPQHAPALHLLGVLLHGAGRVDQAISMVRQAVTIAPIEAKFLSNLCEMLRQRGHIDEAITFGERAIKANPQSVSALSNLGICYYDKKIYDRAKELQNQALAINPQFIPAINNLGSIAKQTKELDEARDHFDRVLRLKPDHIESLSNLGAVHLSAERLDDALQVLAKALKLNPKYAEAHCNAGATLMMLNRRSEARKAFTAAMQLKSDYFEAITGMARLHLAENSLSEALEFAQAALRVCPEEADGHALLGDAHAALGNSVSAARAFEQALVIDAENIGAIVSSGQLLLELGHLDEAEAKFNRALSIDEDSVLAKTALVQARKVTEDDSVFDELITLADGLEDMFELKAMGIHFALGKGFDDRKEYARAFEHYAAGCKIKRRHVSYNREAYSHYVARIKQFFTRERLKQMRGETCLDDTPIFVLGMPRSGTTLTEQIIASHPMVFGAGELHDLLRISSRPNDWETAGFPTVFSGFNVEQLRAAGQKYIDGLKRRAPEARHITDKMPANFHLVGLIHLILPNAKIVHIRRSPIDTCLSNFTRHFAHNSQPQSYDLRDIGFHYRQYHDLMSHWRNVLPDDAWYELDYERLVDDTENEAKALISYCNLEWDERCLEFHKTKRGIKTASVTQVRQPIYKTSVERWRTYESHLEPLFEALGSLAPERSPPSAPK